MKNLGYPTTLILSQKTLEIHVKTLILASWLHYTKHAFVVEIPLPFTVSPSHH